MIVAGHVNMAKQTFILDHKFLILDLFIPDHEFLILDLELLMDKIAAARVTTVHLPRSSWIGRRITERFLSRVG